jgi:hypothetical protein
MKRRYKPYDPMADTNEVGPAGPILDCHGRCVICGEHAREPGITIGSCLCPKTTRDRNVPATFDALPDLWQARRAARLACRKHRDACASCRAYWLAPVGAGHAYGMCGEGTRLYEAAREAFRAVEAAGSK